MVVEYIYWLTNCLMYRSSYNPTQSQTKMLYRLTFQIQEQLSYSCQRLVLISYPACILCIDDQETLMSVVTNDLMDWILAPENQGTCS